MAGDQPGVLMDLIDEVRLLGFRPILAGNIKSLLDHRRTPETQRGFAEAVFQRPKMITSFADGTKISAEMAVVANATGFGVSVRGMEGPRATRVEEAPGLFDMDALLERPIVDYIIGAEPSFGVFVLGHGDNELVRRYMKIYKMGEGPVYTFYRPYHLSPFETPMAVARAVLFNDPVITPLGAPVCEVVSIAKRDLKAGEVLDGIGGFTVFGDIENAGRRARRRPPADRPGRRRAAAARPADRHARPVRRRRPAGGPHVRAPLARAARAGSTARAWRRSDHGCRWPEAARPPAGVGAVWAAAASGPSSARSAGSGSSVFDDLDRAIPVRLRVPRAGVLDPADRSADVVLLIARIRLARSAVAASDGRSASGSSSGRSRR